MEVVTERYIRKPLYVDAVRVSPQNFDDIASWCQGEVMTDEVQGTGTTKKYIKVRVHNPKNPRQTKAFIGDWILYTDRGYKVYTNKAFRAAFDLVEGVEPKIETETPTRLGNVSYTPEEKDQRAVQELDAPLTEDEEVGAQAEEETLEALEERRIQAEEITEGVRAKVPEPPEETELHQSTKPIPVDPELLEDDPGPVDEVVQAESRPPVQTAVDEHTTPQGEPHEYVEATPAAIADAVSGEQSIEPVDEGVAVESSPTSPPVASPPEVAPEPQPVSEQPPEVAAAGKQVLSESEQQRLGPDKVRELVSSGDAILAQDLAQSA